MIKSEKGVTSISGDLQEIMHDTTAILRGFRLGLGKKFGADITEELVRTCVKFSFMSEEEAIEEMKKSNRE